MVREEERLAVHWAEKEKAMKQIQKITENTHAEQVTIQTMT